MPSSKGTGNRPYARRVFVVRKQKRKYNAFMGKNRNHPKAIITGKAGDIVKPSWSPVIPQPTIVKHKVPELHRNASIYDIRNELSE